MFTTGPYIAVGIPSFQEVERIPYVVTCVDRGLAQICDSSKCIIINLDSYSTDGTNSAFLSTTTKSRKVTLSIPRGKGRAMLAFFEFCAANSIKYCATVDADLESIEPDWIPLLLKPIIEGLDFTIPVYTRNRFESNITNQYAFPLISSIYKVKLRQPLGGEFGYSQRFCEYLLTQPKHPKTLEYGIDIFITSNAVAGGFLIREVYLGRKIHAPSFYHMESTFRQVFESGLFVTNLHTQFHKPRTDVDLSPRSSGVDEHKYFPQKAAISRLLIQLSRRFDHYKGRDLYSPYLDKNLIERISNVVDGSKPQLNVKLWAETLASFIKAYSRGPSDSKSLATMSRILFPIYRLRAVSYWLQVENMSSETAEEEIQRGAILLEQSLSSL